MLRIGLTGGIATGKSTVSRYLLSQGHHVVDADLAARQVVAPGQAGLAGLVDLCGPSILTPEGTLDRAQFGQRLFADEALRQAVDQLLHPLIYQVLEDQAAWLAQQGVEQVFFDIPLLFETGYQAHLDQVWLVYVPAEVQIERLMARNHWTRPQAQAAIASQAPIEDKRALADVILDNQGTEAQTFAQVDSALEALLG